MINGIINIENDDGGMASTSADIYRAWRRHRVHGQCRFRGTAQVWRAGRVIIKSSAISALFIEGDI